MKKKVFSVKKFIVFLFFLCLIICGVLVLGYFYLITGSKDNETVNIYVNEGDTSVVYYHHHGLPLVRVNCLRDLFDYWRLK